MQIAFSFAYEGCLCVFEVTCFISCEIILLLNLQYPTILGNIDLAGPTLLNLHIMLCMGL